MTIPEWKCTEGARLRYEYQKLPDVVTKTLYQDHLRICQDCQKYYQDLTDAASKAVHPEEME